MFDAKNLLEILMKGGQQAQPSQATTPGAGRGMGGLGDLLGQVLAGAKGNPAGAAAAESQGGGSLADILGKLSQQGGAGAALGGGGLGDLLGKVLGQGQPANAAPNQASPAGGQDGGGLADIFKKLQGQIGGAGGGSLTDILGQVLGQATSGVSEGARKLDEATGASAHARAAAEGATGKSPDEIMNQIKDWVAKNQMGAGAAAGGLGAIVLGTHAGRALAGRAVKLGALALIGGLAYKALQNYQAGKPLISADDAAHLTEAPRGTGYETAAVTHESALLYIRAMIAAAAADGRIDAGEQQRIFGGLKQAGLEAGAEDFLAKELNNPATVDDLIAGVKTEQEAVQVYTAARVAVDVDSGENHEFLAALAAGLGIDAQLAQHIDAAARGAA